MKQFHFRLKTKSGAIRVLNIRAKTELKAFNLAKEKAARLFNIKPDEFFDALLGPEG